MNRALWKKAVSDAWRQLLASSLLLILFTWVFVWLMSQFPAGKWGVLLGLLPDFVRPMIGVDLARLATPLGQLSILYVHVITLLVCVGWGLGRGSDSISGEIGRGTMDLILALPVWRVTVMTIPAVVATIGSVALVASVWLGTVLGLLSFKLDGVRAAELLPGAVNLFAMTFCFTGITTFVSSWNRDRWRTIAWAGGYFILSLIVKMIARMWQGHPWLFKLSFLAAFEPQELILMPEGSAAAMRYNVTLLGVGLFCYAGAGIIFWRRDIPGPR